MANPDNDQLNTYGQLPLARLQRAGATGGQITTITTWWNNAGTTPVQKVQHGLLIEQVADSDVAAYAAGAWPIPSLATALNPANQAHD